MRSLLGWPRFLPFAAMLALPALAQDAPPPPPAPPPAQPQVSGQEAPKAESSDRADRFGEIYAEVQVWGVRPSGTQFIPASVVSSDGSYSTNYRMGDDQRTSFLYQAGYWFRNRDWGGILGSYWDSNANDDSNVSSPGVFQFFEALPVQPYAGYRNDGLADAYAALSETITREFRLDYTREAFRGGVTNGTWLVGFRNFAHQRNDKATYYALAPADLPPLINPARADMIPIADSGQSSSAYSGNGLEAGLNLEFKVHKKVSIETGFTAAMLWGTLETGYQTLTSVYVVNPDQDGEYVLPAEQYQQVFLENPTLTGLGQKSFPGVASYQQSSNVQALGIQLGVRWRAWRGLEVSAGFRGSRYDNAAARLEPQSTRPDLTRRVTLIQSASVTTSAVTFYGLYAGVAYRY